MSKQKSADCVERVRNSMLKSMDRTLPRIKEVEELLEYLWEDPSNHQYTRTILDRCLRDLKYNYELQTDVLDKINNWEDSYNDMAIPLSGLETIINEVHNKYIRMMRVETRS